MLHGSRITSFFFTVATMAILLLPQSLLAMDDMDGIDVQHPWSRPLPPVSANGAAYLVITNHGKEAVTLSGGSTPRANTIELHEHVHQDGLMKMHEIAGGIPIAPGETVSLQPGGLHVMLMGLTEPMVAGEQYPLTLEFEGAESIEVQVMISDKAPGGMDKEHGHEESHEGSHTDFTLPFRITLELDDPAETSRKRR